VTSTLGLYHPGDSLLHRAPAGLKLAALVAAGVATIWVRTPAAVAAYLVLALVGLVATHAPVRSLARQLRPVALFAVVIAVFQVLVNGPERAFVVVGLLVGLVLLATVVTLTTRTTALVDVVVRAAAPLRRLGVDPERLGLLLALGIRAVPVVVGLASDVRDAQRARGLTSRPSAFAVPLIVRSLRHADRVGEALAARGLDD